MYFRCRREEEGVLCSVSSDLMRTCVCNVGAKSEGRYVKALEKRATLNWTGGESIIFERLSFGLHIEHRI